MRSRKQEWVPREMIKIVEEELQNLRRERNYPEPTRVEAWQRIADRMTRRLIKRK